MKNRNTLIKVIVVLVGIILSSVFAFSIYNVRYQPFRSPEQANSIDRGSHIS